MKVGTYGIDFRISNYYNIKCIEIEGIEELNDFEIKGFRSVRTLKIGELPKR